MYEFDEEKLQNFSVIAEDSLRSFENHVLLLGEDTESAEALNDAFESIQRIKELAHNLEFEKITKLTHGMASLLDLVRDEKAEITQTLIEVQFSAKDVLNSLICSIVDGKEDAHISIVESLEKLNKLDKAASKDESNEIQPEVIETVNQKETPQENNFDEETLHDFTIETEENLQYFEDSLLLLEEEPDNMEGKSVV